MFKKFYIIFCLIIFLVIPFFNVQAQTFDPQVEIPGEKMGGEDIVPGKSIEVTSTSFSEYVIAIYNWSLRALAILAVVMIMVGGFRWVTAGGNATVTGKAKDQIISALVGLLIGLGSYALLNFINPSLTILRDLRLDPIEKVKINCRDFETEEECLNNLAICEWKNDNCVDRELLQKCCLVRSEVEELIASNRADDIVCCWNRSTQLPLFFYATVYLENPNRTCKSLCKDIKIEDAKSFNWKEVELKRCQQTNGWPESFLSVNTQADSCLEAYSEESCKNASEELCSWECDNGKCECKVKSKCGLNEAELEIVGYDSFNPYENSDYYDCCWNPDSELDSEKYKWASISEGKNCSDVCGFSFTRTYINDCKSNLGY